MITFFFFIAMLYIILVSVLVVFLIFIIVPAVIFYILFKTKYRSIIESGNFSEIVSAWMNKFNSDFTNSYGGNRSSSSSMSVEEAFELLNLKRNPRPTKKEINDSYHALIRKFHPDKGGSDYFAKKLNEARNVLMHLAK